MDTTQETHRRATLSRRHLMVGAAGAAIVVAAGAGLYLWHEPEPAGAAPSPGTEVSMTELMTPGPLGDEALGAADAPVTIVEYASMTCPHCAHFHQTTYPELKRKYVETGKLRFIFREFPLDQLAAAASMLARSYSLQLWDCVVCAASVHAGAKVLLTEDMQDGRSLEGLRLVNPFAPANTGAIDALLTS